MDKMNTFMPVVLIRGFLDAGKSTYLNSLLKALDSDGNKLLISCEEGEVEYDSCLLQEKHVTVVALEDEDDFQRETLEQLSQQLQPSCIFIECNAMWKMIEFEMPGNWHIEKRIALLAGPTLDLYLINMRALLGPMLSRCDEIIINRSAPELLVSVKQRLRPLLDDISAVSIVTDHGTYSLTDVKDCLPYSMEQEIVEITPQNYVFWFYDCQDNRSRYEGKTISVAGDIKKSPVFQEHEFALGKIAITCCEADMSFLGFLARYEGTDIYDQFTHVRVVATVQYRYMQNYQKVMPYLQVIHMEPTPAEEKIASFF